MAGVNAAIEVGKQRLQVALGSDGEQFSEPHEARAIKRLSQRLAAAGCERVLLEGGSYQTLLVAALQAAQLPVVSINPRRVRGIRQEHRAVGQDRPARCSRAGTVRRAGRAAAARATR
jgi:hypothetical protein